MEWFEGARSALPAEARDIISKTMARKRMQDRYIAQIFELYADFHVVLMPLLDNEVRRRGWMKPSICVIFNHCAMYNSALGWIGARSSGARVIFEGVGSGGGGGRRREPDIGLRGGGDVQ